MSKSKKPIKRIIILWFDLHKRKPTKGAKYTVHKRFPKRLPIFIITNNIATVLEGHYDILSTQEIERFSKLDMFIRKRQKEFKKVNRKVYTLDCMDLPHDIWILRDE